MKKARLDTIIKFTTNYSLFKLVFGNRKINQAHVKRIKASMMENPLITLIIVNERMEIIDGQHRFYALQELGLPVYYVIINGYGKKEVQIYNVNTSSWKKNDYLQSYCEQGLDDYVLLKKFCDSYPDLIMTNCMKLLSGYSSSDKYGYIDGVKTIKMDFEQGKFKVKDYKLAEKYANMILDFKPYFDRFNDNSFVLALLQLFVHKDYNHKTMISKVSYQSGSMKVCSNKKTYLDMLENIYNYKNRIKVNFRY